MYLLPVPQFRTIIRDGQFVQDPHAINSFATIGQDNNGAHKMAWSQKFDGKLYAFPFRDGSSFTARVQSDGTVWMPRRPFPESRWFCGTGMS